jgi:hypothetical protein
MTLQQIITQAQQVDAVQFNKFLDYNKIRNTWHDVTLTDFNDGPYHITLTDFDNYNILFYDGIYEQ